MGEALGHPLADERGPLPGGFFQGEGRRGGALALLGQLWHEAMTIPQAFHLGPPHAATQPTGMKEDERRCASGTGFPDRSLHAGHLAFSSEPAPEGLGVRLGVFLERSKRDGLALGRWGEAARS